MGSWKRRNQKKCLEAPKVKKARLLAKRISELPDDDEPDSSHTNGDRAEENTMPLFDFTSPKRLFQSLIQPVEFKEFFDSSWEQQPLLLKRNMSAEQLTELTELFSKKTLLQLVKNNEMYFTKDMNALRYKDGKREDLNDVGRITAGKLIKLFNKDKGTVQIHQPQRFQVIITVF